MNKLYLLTSYLEKNNEFDKLTIGQNSITFEGKTIDFTDFDIEKYINDSSKLISDIDVLPMSDVFKIIKLHVDYARVAKRLEEEQAALAVEKCTEQAPVLNKFHVFINFDNFGYDKSFLKYMDESGRVYVFQDVTSADLLSTYLELQKDAAEVTESEIFSNLASKYKQIKLENLYDAEKRMGVSEEHLNNLRSIEQKNNEQMENHNVVLGNEEFNIYINNGNVITMGYNKDGNKVVEKHDVNTVDDATNLTTDVVNEYDEQQLISFEEYTDIISYREELSADEREKVINFENFLSDLITYKDYLTYDLYKVEENYYKFWDFLESSNENTVVIEEAKARYRAMQDRSAERKAINPREQVTLLERRLDNTSSYGYINALLYVGAVIFVGIVVAVITVLAK